jgi:hypothetical protein
MAQRRKQAPDVRRAVVHARNAHPAALHCSARYGRPRLSSATSLLNHLVSTQQQPLRDGDAERLRGLEVDDQLELGRLFNRQIAGLRAFEDLVHIGSGTPEQVGDARPIGAEPPIATNSLTKYIAGSRCFAASSTMRSCSTKSTPLCNTMSASGCARAMAENAHHPAGVPDLDELKLTTMVRAAASVSLSSSFILHSPKASRCQRAAAWETVGNICFSSSRRLRTSSAPQRVGPGKSRRTTVLAITRRAVGFSILR